MSDPLVVKDITGVDNKTILECYKKEFTEESVEKILDALRPHGKWIMEGKIFDGVGDSVLVRTCSICKKSFVYRETTPNYCSNCGAKMDGEETDNDTDIK